MAKAKKPKVKQTHENFDVKAFVEKTLRGAFKKTAIYHEAKRRAKREFFEKSKHDKDLRRVHYECATCKGMFFDRKGAKEIAVDHIDPVVDPEVGSTDYHTYIQRLFCSVDNLQVLCNYKGERNGKKSCHKIKTAEENARRREAEARRKLATP